MTNKSKKNERYVHIIFSILKKREKIGFTGEKTNFNNTEIRLLTEILDAKYQGKRLISTQIAEQLGITRSAVSQRVNRLEEQGIVKRVADAVDRKIAYIEITEKTLSLYEEDLKKSMDFVGGLVEKFGEDKFEQMYALLDEFMKLLENEKANIKSKK